MSWRCVICFVFMALTLKSLLSHINRAHGRSPDFRVICGIDGCAEEYRVFNSFYYHIKCTHALYLSTGCPPRSGTTETNRELTEQPDRDPSQIGLENFDTPIFSGCTKREPLTTNLVHQPAHGVVVFEEPQGSNSTGDAVPPTGDKQRDSDSVTQNTDMVGS